jgi:hypothetical protein
MRTDEVENYISELIKSKSGRENIFLKLNESDLYDKNIENTICHFPNCKNLAIGSHTYPKSFLKKFSGDNTVFATDIKHIVENVYESKALETVKKTNIKHSGVKPLFCSSHDTEVFKRIELPQENVDLETYICLFLYRAFIYDYQIESAFHNPSLSRKLNSEKAYSKKISKNEYLNYFAEQFLVTNIIKMNNDFNSYDILKQKFDNIFISNASPKFENFKEQFSLVFYDLGFVPEFLASGTMYLTLDKEKKDSPLESIFAIVPDKTFKTSYFSILTPKESLDSINTALDNLKNEYYNHKQVFIKSVEFILLDASQNIIMNSSLYEELKSTGKDKILEKINYALVIARLQNNSEYTSAFKEYAWNLLQEISLIKNND